MRVDWSNVSAIELVWSLSSLLAFLVTLMMVDWVRRRFDALRSKIQRFPTVYRRWGPRWNFLLLLLGALVSFGIGWLGYAAIGVVAMMTPPPMTATSDQAADWLAWLLIGMEATHAIAQGLVWAALLSLAGEPLFPRLRRVPRRGEAA